MESDDEQRKSSSGSNATKLSFDKNTQRLSTRPATPSSSLTAALHREQKAKQPLDSQSLDKSRIGRNKGTGDNFGGSDARQSVVPVTLPSSPVTSVNIPANNQTVTKLNDRKFATSNEEILAQINGSHRQPQIMPRVSRSDKPSSGNTEPSQHNNDSSEGPLFVTHDQLISRQIEKSGIRLRKPSAPHMLFSVGRSGLSVGSSFAQMRHNSWSAAEVTVRRKASLDKYLNYASGSSVNPSPAASFLASFADVSVSKPPHGQYDEGDEIGAYLLVKEIGTGSSSRVFEAVINKEDQPLEQVRVAMKVVPKPIEEMARASVPYSVRETPSTSRGSSVSTNTNGINEQRQSTNSEPNPEGQTVIHTELSQEIALWSRLHHPYILEMEEVIELDDANIIVCELATGGTLLDFIRRTGSPGLPEHLSQKLFWQLCSAVGYLHDSIGVLHRDIKLENILLDDDTNVKLTDFGLSEELLLVKDEPFREPEYTADEEAKTEIVSPLEPIRLAIQTNYAAESPDNVNQADSIASPQPPTSAHVRRQSESSMSGQSSPFAKTLHLSLPRSKLRKTKEQTHFIAGSLHYCAPEDLHRISVTPAPSIIFEGHINQPEPAAAPSLTPLQGTSSDMWAMGCVLYAMVVGNLPFSDSFLPRLQLCIMNGKYDVTALKSSGASEGCCEVIQNLLSVVPGDRWTVKRLMDHPWVKQGQ